MAANLVITIVTEAAKAQKELKQTSQDVEGLGKSTSNMGKVVAAGAAAGVAGLVALGVSAFEAAQESARIGRETERVIRTTGAAAWTSAKQVSELSSAISEKTGADDEAVQSGANLLLTFTNVQNVVGEGNDVFDQATELALDMSTALGTDMSGAAIQLGKALNDPIKGITALSKAGVSFTEQQKEQIRALVEAGDVLGAQKIVLAELKKEFGGAAETAGTPFEKLQVAIGNLQEDIGSLLIPAASAVASFMLDNLGPAVEKTTQFFSEHTELMKYLASVGLVGLAAAYGPVVLAQAAVIGSGIVGFITQLTGYVGALSAIFLETAASEGVLAAATGTLSLTMLPLAAALAVLGGVVYAFTAALDTSSETADDFFASVTRPVDTSSYEELSQSHEKIHQHLQDLKVSIEAQKHSWGGLAGAVGDILIPFHDVEGSLNDQQDEYDTLNAAENKRIEALNASVDALKSYAAAQSGATDVLKSSEPASLTNLENVGKTSAATATLTQKLLDIANAEKIDLTTPDAVDRVQALYEKTLATTSGTLGMSEAQEKYNDATATAKDKTDAFKLSLDALVGVHLSAAEAETNYSENSVKLLETLTKNRAAAAGQTDAMNATSVAQTKAINESDSAIQANIKSVLDLANAQFQETGNLQQATGTLNAHREALINVMVQTGYTREEAERYVDRLGLTPDAINTQVNLDAGQAKTDLGDVNQGLDKADQGAHGKVTLDTGQAESALSKLGGFFTGIGGWLQGKALGGPVDGGTPYLVGERGPELFLPGRSGFIVPAQQTASLMSGSSTVNVTINHTGLGIDSPRLQRDLVGALQRYTQREGPVRF